jgi:RimJ/RimL family protein N-acetyltransferase
MKINKMESTKYLFLSERLGFRQWYLSDLEELATLNADPLVMEFFPNLVNKDKSEKFIQKMQTQYSEKGYCYFAVDRLDNQKLVGFIGLSDQFFESTFTPCTDIGWRIKSSEWNKGYATEGAQRCLKFAKHELKLDTIYSITPVINIKSQHVMIKLGMHKILEFQHPSLHDYESLKTCVLYKIDL